MRMRRVLELGGLAISGSVLYAAPVVYDSLGSLAFVSTVPWLLLTSDRTLSFRASSISFLASVYGAGLLCLPWLRSFNVVAWLVAPLFYVPLFLPIIVITRALRSAWPTLPLSILWPIGFTGGEYLRIRLSAGEIPFAQLGASLISFHHLIQVADVAGVWALTLLAALIAGQVTDTLSMLSKATRPVSLRRLVAMPLAIVGTISAQVVYGAYRLRPTSFDPGPRVLVVQPNFPSWDVTPELARERFAKLLQLTSQRAVPGTLDLIAWPENSVIPYEPYDEFGRGVDQDNRLRALAAETHAAVLIDGPTFAPRANRHTAAIVHPDGHVSAYHKRLLVPWSEYVPYEGALRHLNNHLARWFVAFVQSHNPHLQLFAPGQHPTLFYIAGPGEPTALGAPICYETLSAPYMLAWAVAARKAGASRFFIVNPVNEKLLGSAVHTKTLAFCRFRAIESRVTVIRAANNGISAAIDPNGHVYATVRGADGDTVDRSGTIEVTVLFDPRFGTIYSRWGDWLPIFCLVAGAAAVTRLSFLTKLRSKQRVSNEHRLVGLGLVISR